MSKNYQVVVYAASGYTGRLTCEALAKLRVPFIAAGRSQDKLDAIVSEMRALGGDCEARVVAHTAAGLSQLLRGMRVVINTSGPFSLLGRAVVDAALHEHCHYLDTTGEQDFMLEMQREYGARFEREKLLLSPSTAFLWTVGNLAAEVCLETAGIDSLKIINAPPALQTVASLQSMLRSGRRPSFVLAERKLVLVPVAQIRYVLVPDTLELRRALSIGAGDATFFIGDARVRNCETLFASEGLAQMAGMMKLWSRMSSFVPGDTLDKTSDALVLKYKKDPPPEQPETSRFVVTALGEGNGQRVQAVVHGHSPYVVTGFLGAMAVQTLLEGKLLRAGYASIAQAFGARYALRRLEEIGTHMNVEPSTGRSGVSAIAQPPTANLFEARSA